MVYYIICICVFYSCLKFNNKETLGTENRILLQCSPYELPAITLFMTRGVIEDKYYNRSPALKPTVFFLSCSESCSQASPYHIQCKVTNRAFNVRMPNDSQ